MRFAIPTEGERPEFTAWRAQIIAAAAKITDDPAELRALGDQCVAARCFGLADDNYERAALIERGKRLLIAIADFRSAAWVAQDGTAVFFADNFRREIASSDRDASGDLQRAAA